jgi:hypothetical protein
MGHLRVKRLLADDWGCVTGKDARRNAGGRSQVPGIAWPALKELRTKFTDKHGAQTWLIDADDWQEPPKLDQKF